MKFVCNLFLAITNVVNSKRSFNDGKIVSQVESVCPELSCKMNRKMFGKSNRNLHGHKISSSREEFFIVN